MAVITDEMKVSHDHDYPSFLEIQVRKKQKYIEDVELKNKYLKRDRWNGWFAAGTLAVVLGIVLYQWLVAEVLSCTVH
jgi:hypothetical protein